MAPNTSHRDSLTCDECGCFPRLSHHDDLCLQWTEPSEPLDVDAPISYVLTDQGRSAITAAPVH